MAVGATALDIFKLVFKLGMIPLIIGLTIGLVASIAVNRVLSSELVQVSYADPTIFVIAGALLVLPTALGCCIPARRAVRIDPVAALRDD